MIPADMLIVTSICDNGTEVMSLAEFSGEFEKLFGFRDQPLAFPGGFPIALLLTLITDDELEKAIDARR